MNKLIAMKMTLMIYILKSQLYLFWNKCYVRKLANSYFQIACFNFMVFSVYIVLTGHARTQYGSFTLVS